MKVHIPGLWIPQLQRKDDRYLTEATRIAGFSHQDQIHLCKDATILQVHTVSNTTTLYGISAMVRKKIIVVGVHDVRSTGICDGNAIMV